MRWTTSFLAAFACMVLLAACSNNSASPSSADATASNSSLSLPSGDLRDPALTASQEARAEEAYRLFETFQPTRESYYRDEVFDPNDAEQAAFFEERLREVAAKYEGQAFLAPEEKAEVSSALSPYVTYLALLQAKKSNALVIPAGAKLAFDLPAYCLDSQRASPKPGESFQLVPATSLVPVSLAPIYEGLLQRAADKGAGHDELTQSLLWTIRNSVLTGRQIDLAYLGDPARARIQDSSPDYAAALATYNATAPRPAVDPPETPSWGSYLTDLMADLGKQAYRVSGLKGQIEAIEESFDQWGRLARSTAAMVPGVRQQLAALDQMPVDQPLPDPTTGYNLLATGVAARATSPKGGAARARVEIANTTNIPTVFSPDSCIAQSTRNVQRIALQNTTEQDAFSLYPIANEKITIASATYSKPLVYDFSGYSSRFVPAALLLALPLAYEAVIASAGAVIAGSVILSHTFDDASRSIPLNCLGQSDKEWDGRVPAYVYHYTTPSEAQLIMAKGIKAFKNEFLIYTTPNGMYGFPEAESLLSLPPREDERRSVVLQIDAQTLFELQEIYPVHVGVVQPRPDYGGAGGGVEVVYGSRIPVIDDKTGTPIIKCFRGCSEFMH